MITSHLISTISWKEAHETEHVTLTGRGKKGIYKRYCYLCVCVCVCAFVFLRGGGFSIAAKDIMLSTRLLAN